MATAPGGSGLGGRDIEAAPRIELIDALRGFALGGILQVNLQSFVWGAGEPLGYFEHTPDAAGQALFWLQAALLEGKFYPLFAFLFGVGFALQMRKMRRLCGGDRVRAGAMYRRRALFLLALGSAHGLLLYFGDVLVSYAVCALLLSATAPVRPRPLCAFARTWGVLAAASLLAPLAWDLLLPAIEPPEQIPAASLAAHAIYVDAGYVDQLQQRALDDLWQLLSAIVSFWPQVMALFALGAVAGRLGWLRHPRRHPRVWRLAWRIGLGVGLPCALVGASMHLASIRDRPGGNADFGDVVFGASSLLAFAYVAAAVRWREARWMRALVIWLAPAGRMPLTNYVAQSAIMGALLSGWGLGWGAHASRAGLSLLGLAIYVAQLAFSRWFLGRCAQGPLEAWWRRVTYRGLASAASNSTLTHSPD